MNANAARRVREAVVRLGVSLLIPETVAAQRSQEDHPPTAERTIERVGLFFQPLMDANAVSDKTARMVCFRLTRSQRRGIYISPLLFLVWAPIEGLEACQEALSGHLYQCSFERQTYMTPVGHQTRIPGGRYHFLAVGYGLNEISPKWIESSGPAYLIPLGPLSLPGLWLGEKGRGERGGRPRVGLFFQPLMDANIR
jgi:hypothetical protein